VALIVALALAYVAVFAFLRYVAALACQYARICASSTLTFLTTARATFWPSSEAFIDCLSWAIVMPCFLRVASTFFSPP